MQIRNLLCQSTTLLLFRPSALAARSKPNLLWLQRLFARCLRRRPHRLLKYVLRAFSTLHSPTRRLPLCRRSGHRSDWRVASSPLGLPRLVRRRPALPPARFAARRPRSTRATVNCTSMSARVLLVQLARAIGLHLFRGALRARHPLPPRRPISMLLTPFPLPLLPPRLPLLLLLPLLLFLLLFLPLPLPLPHLPSHCRRRRRRNLRRRRRCSSCGRCPLVSRVHHAGRGAPCRQSFTGS